MFLFLFLVLFAFVSVSAAVLANHVWLPILTKLKPLYQTTSNYFQLPAFNQHQFQSYVFFVFSFFTKFCMRAALGRIFVSVFVLFVLFGSMRLMSLQFQWQDLILL